MCINQRNKSILCFLALAIGFFSFYGVYEMQADRTERRINNLLSRAEKGNLSLTVYYLSPTVLTLLPVSVDSLINGGYEYTFSIEGNDLKEYLELFRKLGDAKLETVKQKSRINARIYYVFEDKKTKKILDVAMWGNDDSIFINGIEFKWEKVFYDIIRPFLPEDIVEYMDKQCKAIMQNK